MRRAIALVVLLLLSGCTGSSGQHTARQHTCAVTPVRHGNAPRWTGAANPPSAVPFVISKQGNVVGFLFGSPLTADNHRSLSNKILWVMRTPRDGRPLNITATRGNSVVRKGFPADSSPGEIYPSIVDVPTAGCWHFALVWNGTSASVDLRYA